MNFTNRIAWAINRTKRKNRLSWPKIAKILGTNKDTIATYAKSKGDKIIAPVLIGLASEFKYSSSWLLTGEGEPFPGARRQFPEVCGPDTLLYKEKEREAGGEVKEGNALYQAGVDHSTDLLKNILSSDDPVMIQAILSNLRAFNQAIQSRQKDKDRIAELETRVASLEEKHKPENPHGHDHESKKSAAT